MAESEKIVIEIALDRLIVAPYDDRTFPQHVAALAADLLLEREVKGGNWHDAFHERVKRIRDEEIVSYVRPLIEEALQVSVQQTDAFGTPRGEPTTLRDLILKKVKDELRLTADSRGSYRDTKSLLEQVVDGAVRRELGRELRDAVAEGRKQVLAAVKDEAAAVIGETIARHARA